MTSLGPLAVAISALTAVVNLYLIILTFLFYSMRKEDIIQKRLPNVVFVLALIYIVFTNFTLIISPVFSDIFNWYPCIVKIIERYVFTPVWSYCCVLRIAYLAIQDKLSQLKLGQSVTSASVVLPKSKAELLLLWILSHMFTFGKNEGPKPDVKKKKKVKKDGLARVEWMLEVGTPRMNNKDLFLQVFLVIAFMGLLLTVEMFTGATDFTKLVNETDANCGIINFMPMVIGNLFLFLIVPYFFFILRTRESNGMYVEIKWLLIFSSICLALFFVLVSSHNNPYRRFLLASWQVVCFSLTLTYPVYLVYRNRRVYQSVSRRGTAYSFNGVLTTAKELDKFKAILASQFCMENILFYERYIELERLFKVAEKQESKGDKKPSAPPGSNGEEETHSTEQLELRVMRLYHEFIRHDSPHELNISAELRSDIEADLANGNRHIHIFKDISEEVYRLMYDNSYPLYLMQQKEGTV
jgi:hypothetical protein